LAFRKALAWGSLVLVVMLTAHVGSRSVFSEPVQSVASVAADGDYRIFLPLVSKQCGSCFFVDSVNGSDSNPGTSEEKPWQTLAPVHATTFSPGSIVYFKRGSAWSGGLVIDDSGTAGRPILFTTYGAGNTPVFSNPGSSDNRTRAVRIKGDYIILEGIMTQDAYEAGVEITEGADYNIVRDVEATQVGIGILIYGQHNLITRNYIHDLHMVRNTPGGNDDYGAMGIVLSDSNNEVSYNRLIRCIASSYDFGVDGGAIEWSGTADGNLVHHNYALDNDGFLEVGGGSARDAVVAYNVAINNGRFSLIHLTGSFASAVSNFKVENNTIVENANSDWEWTIFGFNGDPTADTFWLRNNIVYANKFSTISPKSTFSHHHNLFSLTGATLLGFSLGQGESIADPLFTNLTTFDLHLQPNSTALNAGATLGYALDFDDQPVPVGSAPDLGAFEFQGTP
jgi:hypothetical protein